MLLKSFILILLSSFTLNARANCECKPDIYAAGYKKIEKHWWGETRVFTCMYHCESGADQADIKGTKTVDIIWEQGNETICDGAIYKSVYSESSSWFIFRYDHSFYFDAHKAKTPEVRAWAQSTCK